MNIHGGIFFKFISQPVACVGYSVHTPLHLLVIQFGDQLVCQLCEGLHHRRLWMRLEKVLTHVQASANNTGVSSLFLSHSLRMFHSDSL